MEDGGWSWGLGCGCGAVRGRGCRGGIEEPWRAEEAFCGSRRRQLSVRPYLYEPFTPPPSNPPSPRSDPPHPPPRPPR